MQFEYADADDSTDDATDPVAPGTSCCDAYPYSIGPDYCPLP